MILLLSPVIFEGLVAFILLTESVNESEDGLDCVSSAVLLLLELAFFTGDKVVSTFGLAQGLMPI